MKEHVSDILYRIHNATGRTFSFNDINHIVTNSQISALSSKGLIIKTGKVLPSASKTKPHTTIPQWFITEHGMMIMKRYAIVHLRDLLKS